MKKPKMPFNRKQIRKCCEIIQGNVNRKAWNEVPDDKAKYWVLGNINKRRVERLK